MKRKIKTGDKVILIAGKRRGEIGVVKEMLIEKDRVIVEGVNMLTKFNKKTGSGITKKEGSIHISNLAHIDPASGKPTRVKIEMQGENKVLIAKKSGKVIR